MNDNIDNIDEVQNESPEEIAKINARLQKSKEDAAAAKGAKVAAKVVAEKYAPGIGGKVVDAAANTKTGQAMLNRAGSNLFRSRTSKRFLNKLDEDGTLDKVDSASSMIAGSSATNSASNNLDNVNTGLTNNSNIDDDISGSNAKMSGSGDHKMINFIKKHPEVLGTAGMIALYLAFIIFILMIILMFVAGVKGSSGSSSSSSSSAAVSSNAATTESVNNFLSGTSLSDHLNSKGTNIDEFNKGLIAAVRSAGVSTRAGVVAAAKYITSDLSSKYEARLPYEWGGGHSAMYYGAKGEWGSKLAKPVPGNNRFYLYSGLDCSGFVSWAIYNGGYNISAQVSEGFLKFGPTHPMSNDYVAQAGDLIHHQGHIMIIVGVDEAAKKYYVAEAAGADEGMRVTLWPFDGSISSKQNNIIDMTSFYENESNKATNYPES